MSASNEKPTQGPVHAGSEHDNGSTREASHPDLYVVDANAQKGGKRKFHCNYPREFFFGWSSNL